MTHTQSSQVFRQYCAQIPSHRMHVYARMMATMALVRRYGNGLVERHSQRIARALESMDRQISQELDKGEAA